jgi:hypothetical protein
VNSWLFVVTKEFIIYRYREESSEENSLKTRDLIFAGRIVCTLFQRLATRRSFHVKSTGSAPGGESRKQGANGGGGHGFPSRVASPWLWQFLIHSNFIYLTF